MKERLQQVLKLYGERILFAYLFGSSVKGDNPIGDIDVAVYFALSDKFSYHEIRIDLYLFLSRAMGRNDFDIIVLNTAGNLMLLEEIIRHGVVLIERNKFIREDYELKILHEAIDFKLQRKALMGI